MKIEVLAAQQRAFDERHGWLPKAGDPQSLLEFMRTDVIGLCGEVGEVAGIVKKIGMNEHVGDLHREIAKQMPALHEELIDVLIYLIRLIDYLDVDVEAVFNEKLKKNEIRFRKYDRE